MTKKWDEDEQVDDAVKDLIKEWDDLDQEEKYLVLMNIILKYARIKEIEYEEPEELIELVVPASPSVNATIIPLEKMMDFWFFALENYGLDITIEKKGQCRIHKFSEKEFEIMGKIDELGHEEMFKQLRQARYPTLSAKKSFVDHDIQRQFEWMDRPENEDLIRPEVVTEIRWTFISINNYFH
jgi:hypothetical protein